MTRSHSQIPTTAKKYFDSSREPRDRLAAVLADLGDMRAKAPHTPVKLKVNVLALALVLASVRGGRSEGGRAGQVEERGELFERRHRVGVVDGVAYSRTCPTEMSCTCPGAEAL